jgi:CheY-like chemotaxis protein
MVLIIDDSDATRRMYAKALTRCGLKGVEATNGAEGRCDLAAPECCSTPAATIHGKPLSG